MFKAKLLIPLVVVVVVGGAACSRQRPAPIPRPAAFPRPVVYSESYHTDTLGGLALEVNDSAHLSSPQPGWFNLEYPAYKTIVNCTLTRGGNIAEALNNRAQRMALNIGAAGGDIEQFTSRSGLYVTLITAPEAMRTPVLFLATDSTSMLLSGVAVASLSPSTPVDSVAPQVTALAADMRRLLRQL